MWLYEGLVPSMGDQDDLIHGAIWRMFCTIECSGHQMLRPFDDDIRSTTQQLQP